MRGWKTPGNCKEFIVKKEAQSSQASCRKHSRLYTCNLMLRQIGEKLSMAPMGGNSSNTQFLEVLYASTATTIFVCGELVGALYTAGDNIKHIVRENVDSAMIRVRAKQDNVADVKLPKFEYFSNVGNDHRKEQCYHQPCEEKFIWYVLYSFHD